MTLAKVTESQSATVCKREQEKVSRPLVTAATVYCNTNFPFPIGHIGTSRTSLERGGLPIHYLPCYAQQGWGVSGQPEERLVEPFSGSHHRVNVYYVSFSGENLRPLSQDSV